MRQLAWALFQLAVGYFIVTMFEGVTIAKGPFCLVVVGGTFGVSVIAATLMDLSAAWLRALWIWHLERPERKHQVRLRRYGKADYR